MSKPYPTSVDQSDLTLSVLFPSNFLKAEDLQGRQVTVTVAEASIDVVPMTGGKKERKLVFSLARPDGSKVRKQLIVGKTNGFALALLLCDASPGKQASMRDVVGRRITLVADVDRLKGQEVPAIRIAGSPDATEERAKAYAAAWRGERKGGALIGRIKRVLGLIAMGKPPIVEAEESVPEPVEDEAGGGLFGDAEPGSNDR